MRRLVLALAIAFAPVTARAGIEIVELTTPGGIDVWLVEEPSIPFVAIELRFRGGANLDDPARGGAVNLMASLLDEGAGDRDARSFQERREELAASYSFRAFDDMVSISARVLTENRDDAVDLLRLALTEPRFDDEALERVRGQMLAVIASDAMNPRQIASDRFHALAFGDHPYGSQMNGTAETVAALTRNDMIDAHRSALTRAGAYVSAVGDITADEIVLLVDHLLADLPAEGPALPDRIDLALPGGVTVVPFPGPQSIAFFGHGGLERDDDDFFAAFILNHILGGGGFQSRLMQEVREARGLTYGIGTSLVPRDLSEMWLGSFSSSNDRIAGAIELVREEWGRLASEGVTAEELEAAQTFLTGEYPLRFDGNAEIARIMVGMQMVGLTPDYVLQRNDYVLAVTLDEINRVAAEWLDPDALHFVVVGEPDGLEAFPGQ
ncbi:MAG: insulinase family protein [Rubellimicrobium sp.]|nr:insulinase family protein [Rubellimicrobium sp.]